MKIIIYPPILINFRLCFLIHLILPINIANNRNGIEKPKTYIIIIIIPTSGFVAANDNTIASIGPVQGVHPKENAIPMMKEPTRSEEHTSELQSRFDLVCRLLLEKKKKQTTRKQREHNV